MTKSSIQKALQNYGMTKNESKVFFATTSLGEGSTSGIAQQSGLPRSTVQTVLQKLQAGQYIQSSKKNGKTFFTPNSFNYLITAMQEKRDIAEKVIPSLRNIYNSTQNDSTLFLVEGKSAIKALFNEMLEMYRGGVQEVQAISNTQKLLELFPRFFPDWAQKEAVYPVKIKMLVPKDVATHENTIKNPRMQIKHVPDSKEFPGDMTIIQNKVIFFYLEKKNPHAYVVESKEVAQMQKKIFDLLWEFV